MVSAFLPVCTNTTLNNLAPRWSAIFAAITALFFVAAWSNSANAQSTNYWRSAADNNLWANDDGSNINNWFRLGYGDVRRPDLADGQWSATAAKAYNIIIFDNGAQPTMTVNAIGGAKYHVAEIRFAEGTSRTINSSDGGYLAMSNASGVAKIESVSGGTGTYTFNVPILFEENTEINALNGNLVFGSSSTITNNGFTLTSYTSSAKTATFNGVISGDGGLAHKGDGLVTLGAANQYAGATTVEGTGGGRIQIENALALGTTAAGTTVSSGAALQILGSLGTISEALTLNGTGISSGGALRNISGSSTWSGAITLESASRINSDSGTLTIDPTSGSAISGSFNLTLGGAGNITINDPIATSSGTLTKDGAGQVNLAGNNTYTGTTTVSVGSLEAQSASALGTTANGTTVSNGAALRLWNASGVTFDAEALSLVGTGVGGIGALYNAGGANIWQGNITLTGGTRIGAVTSSSLTLSGTIDLGSAENTLYIGGAGNFTFDNNFLNAGKTTGDGALYWDGSGSLRFNQATQSALTGNINLRSGTVLLGAADALGSGDVTASTTSTLTLASADNDARSINNNFTLGGNLTLGQAATGTGAVTLSGTMALGATRTITVNNTLSTISGVIGGNTFGLTKAGSGNLTLTADNSFTGNIEIDAGTLSLSGNGAVSTAGRVNVGVTTTFDIGGITAESATVKEISEQGNNDGGSITLGGKTLVVNGGGADTTRFFNVLGTTGDTGGFTLNAASASYIISLYGTSLYTGITTISAGNLTTSAAMSSSAFVFNGGSFTSTALNGLSDTATMTFGGGSFVADASDTIGALTFNAGGGTITVQTGDTLTTGALSGTAGGLTKSGSGILVLGAAASSYSGTTVFGAGTLRLGNNTALGTGDLTINGGTLASSSGDARTIANDITLGGSVTLGEATTGTGSLTLSGTFDLGDEADTRTLTMGGNHTISGNLSGTRGIVKQGTGQLTLSGANNTSTGGIFIDNGTVNLASGSLSASGIDVGSGVLGVQAANNATLKISSASTFNENITVNAETNSSGVSGLRVIDFANANGTTATLSGTVSLEKQAFITVASGAEGSMTGIISGASGSIVKQGAGTLSLSGENTFATGIFIDSGVVNLAGGSLGTSTIDVGGGANNNVVNAEDATLRVSAALTYSGNFTIHSETNNVGVSGSRFIEFANAASTSAGLSGTVAANKTVIVNVVNSTASGSLTGVISGNGGLTKSGDGTLTLSGDAANTYSGDTLVSAGTLNLNKSAGNAIVGNVTVNSDAVLLLSGSNQVDSGATDVVTLSGGTIQRASGVSEVFGDLNVTQASFLDFSAGTGGTIEFSGLDYTPSALLSLQLVNFTQGNTLIIRNTSNWSTGPGTGFTFGGTGGFGGSTFSDGTFTITAIPEPSTYVAAAGLLAIFLWPVRRRMIKDLKSILGLRPTGRERIEAYRNA